MMLSTHNREKTYCICNSLIITIIILLNVELIENSLLVLHIIEILLKKIGAEVLS